MPDLTPEQREERGLGLLRECVDGGGKIGMVSFKDEDSNRGMPIGPVVLYSQEYVDPGLIPWGSDDPPGMFWLGWLSLRAAQGLAKQFEVELTHW